MLLSMTGFGRASVKTDSAAVNAEIMGVNARYLDMVVKLPPEAVALEVEVRRLVKDKVDRGRVSVCVSMQRVGAAAPTMALDEHAAERYVASSMALAKRLGLKNDLTITAILNCPGVVRTDEESHLDQAEQEAIAGAVRSALEEFRAMKRTEGDSLARELLERIQAVRAALADVEQRLPELNRCYADRLRQRLAEIAIDLSLKEERIAMEVAIMAEKADITEEVVRLKSHIDQFMNLVDGEERSVGRKLEFLVQEMHREANTLAAKNRDSAVIEQTLAIKAELEKIKEQVQNVE
jgi:uncharacterized protein (TIGR00255 family)